MSSCLSCFSDRSATSTGDAEDQPSRFVDESKAGTVGLDAASRVVDTSTAKREASSKAVS
jgi:hypothetical protein